MGATTGTPPPPAPGCAKCGAEVAPGSVGCLACGSPITPPITAAPLPVALAPAVSGREPEKMSVWVPVKLVVGLAATVLATVSHERNAPTPAEAFGFGIGVLLFPLLIALAVVGFKPLRRMRTFSTIFFAVGVIGLGGILTSMRDLSPDRQKTPQEIIKEAAGTKPLTESGSPSERKTDRVLREFMSDMLAARKKHDADVAPVEQVLGTLYTAQSFHGKQEMGDVIAALQKLREIDGQMTDKFEHLPQEFKARLDASDLDDSVKEDVMTGFQKGFGGSQLPAAYHEIHLTEEQWIAASVDLYTYALQHASAIKIVDKKIVIANDSVLTEFNSKFRNSRALRDKLREGNRQLAALQAAAMQKTGISNSDLGLK